MSDVVPNGHVVEVTNVEKVFARSASRWSKHEPIRAVAGVSFALIRRKSLAIVGESGSGKSTVARMLVGLETPTSGSIRILGKEIAARPSTSERRRRGREIQMVFQDPYGSLDPRQRVEDSIDEIVSLHFPSLNRAERGGRISRVLEQVGLSGRVAHSYPKGMSGGQRQRVAIARALAAEPQILVLDEAVASLDVSIQAQILNVLADIRSETDIAYVFISHDLAVVRQVTDDALVMRDGEIVERGTTAKILDAPEHPYTQRLRAAVPRRGWKPGRMRDAPSAG